MILAAQMGLSAVTITGREFMSDPVLSVVSSIFEN